MTAPAGLRFKAEQIEMAHGAGGKATRRLVEGLIAPLLENPYLEGLADAAVVPFGSEKLAMTADSFVVKPLRFPGGSIGDLAVNGTINDLAVSGARPEALLLTLILEAGLLTSVLQAEIEAVARAARQASVPVVGGDTKVVENGKADGMYITTVGVGRVDPRFDLSPGHVRAGDQVLVSGSIGDHGITILLARGELELSADLESDTRSVAPLVFALADAVPGAIRWMRDPTRGGVATALNELARDTGLGVLLHENRTPVRDSVRGACELLGLDPLHIANEGQFLTVVSADKATQALDALRACPGGEGAAIIGEISQSPAGAVLSVADYGGRRVVDMLVGDPLPRIC